MVEEVQEGERGESAELCEDGCCCKVMLHFVLSPGSVTFSYCSILTCLVTLAVLLFTSSVVEKVRGREESESAEV